MLQMFPSWLLHQPWRLLLLCLLLLMFLLAWGAGRLQFLLLAVFLVLHQADILHPVKAFNWLLNVPWLMKAA